MESTIIDLFYNQIKRMVERQKEKYGWEFIFLGANIDAVSTAARFGIGADRAANYNADEEGTRLNFKVVSDVVSELRANYVIDEKWKERVEEDFAKRGKKGN